MLNRLSWFLATLVLGSGSFGAGIGWAQKFETADRNKDKRLSVAEFKSYTQQRVAGVSRFDELFKALDANKDGVLNASEFEKRQGALDKIRGWKKNNPALKVGDIAPTFKLKSLDGKSETDLAAFKGKKPVVLIFGSYT